MPSLTVKCIGNWILHRAAVGHSAKQDALRCHTTAKKGDIATHILAAASR